MSFAGDKHNRILLHSIDETVFLINATAPKTAQILFQGFWFSEAIERIPQDIPDQLIDLF